MNPCKNRSPHASFLLAGLALLLAAAAAATPARAPQPAPGGGGDGISVAGTGEAKGKPTAIEISATVSGDAELAADAIVKYRDTKRRAVEALEGLKLEGLKVESGGFAINQGMDAAQQQAMMQGNAVAGGKQRVTVTEQITVVLGGLDKLKDEELMDTVLKVVDTGRDGGLQIGAAQPRNYYEMQMMYNNGRGNSNLVNFVIPDAEALRDQAYKAAMDDARKRAERLASLAGVKLGRILSVRDQGAVNMSPQQAQVYAMTGQMSAGDSPDQLSSGVFTEIPVRVNLAVQFEIAPAAAPRAGAGGVVDEGAAATALAAADAELSARVIEKFWEDVERDAAGDRSAIRGIAGFKSVAERVAEFRETQKHLQAEIDEARAAAERAEGDAEQAGKAAEAIRGSNSAEVERLRAELEKIKARNAPGEPVEGE